MKHGGAYLELTSSIRDKVLQIKSQSLSVKERTGHLSSNVDGSISLDGEKLGYDDFKFAIENLCTQKVQYSSSSGSLKKTTYYLKIGNDKYQYIKHESGNIEILVNGLLHCPNGPALEKDNVKSWYKRGSLHNSYGPALIDGDQETYYLDGVECTQVHFIENSPASTHNYGIRGDRSYCVSKNGEYAVLRGLDETVALLKKSDGIDTIDDFLLELVGTRIPGYKVVRYDRVGPNLMGVYNYVKNDFAKWKTFFHHDYSKISYSMPDGSKAIMCLQKGRGQLVCKVKAPNGDSRFFSVDMSFDDWKAANDGASPTFPLDVFVYRDYSGRISSRSHAALSLGADKPLQYHIDGLQVTPDEFNHYSSITDKISYFDEFHRLHREDLPAQIDFSGDEPVKSYYEHGDKIDLNATLGDKLINSARHADDTYIEAPMANDDKQLRFEEALRRVTAKHNKVNLAGDVMETKTIKHGDAPATTSDSRFRQVSSGAKLGVKKAALRVASQKAAEKIVEVASPTDNVAVQRIVQLALLIGSAEIMERLPDASGKVGLTDQRKDSFGGLARYVAGETLGRDAVGIVSFIAPMILNELKGISAEEIEELTSDSADVHAFEEAALSLNQK